MQSLGRNGPQRRVLMRLVVACLVLMSGCTSKPAPPPAVATPAPPAEAPPPAAAGLLQGTPVTTEPVSQAEIVRGTGAYVRTPKTSTGLAKTTQGDVTLNFIDADVRDVAKAVLGEALGLNYTVDPGVQGRVTLQTATPITEDAVLPTLEAVFRLNGVALLQKNGLYVLTPLADAKARPSVPRIAGSNVHGYGQQIVQLRFVTVQDMQKVLAAVAPQGGIAYADPARNLLILLGSEEEVDVLVDTIALFDVNFLRAMSFGVFRPRNVTVEGLSKDLESVVGGVESPVAGLLKFIPIPRINALLVIAKEPELLNDVGAWVKRLDVEGDGPAHRKIHLYRVQNAKAAELADTLGRLFGAETSSGSGSSRKSRTPSSATATGSGLAAAGFGTSVLQPTGSLGETQSVYDGTDDGGSEGVAGFAKGGLRVVADEPNNLLMILATPREYEDIVAALKEIDVAPDQVLIEATIAEVTLNDELKYGVQWLFDSNKSTFTFTDDPLGKIISKFPGFSYTYLVPDAQIALNALSSLTNVKVISSPKIMALDNQTASLQVGDEVPIATQSAVSVLDPDAPIVNSIQFRQTGVILEVTPRVSNSGLVTMDVTQEVSDVAATTTSTLNSPTIQQRKFTSTVAVQSGATVALGGLIRDNVSKGKDGIPLLKDIPGLGAAFRSTTNTQRRTELLVFITPRIVRGTDEAREMTDYLRGKLREAAAVMENGPGTVNKRR